VVGKIT